ncbi:GGDEF domain-containing protein [Chitinibacteraceae bacterium HSL-7]
MTQQNAPAPSHPESVAPADVSLYTTLRFVTLLGIPVHVMLVPLFFSLGQHILSLFNVAATLLWVLAYRLNRAGDHASASILLMSEVPVHTVLCVLLLGWHAGFQYYLLAAIPVILFNHQLKTLPLVMISLLFGGLYVVLDLFYGHSGHPTPAVTVDMLYYGNLAVAVVALVVNSFYTRQASYLNEKLLQKLAETDQLTGLTNRRGILPQIEALRELHLRRQTPFSLILCDIDHFKRVNDRYGHACGDQVLQEVAALLTEQSRPYDAICRWGGEEFLLVLPDTSADGARAAAEHLRAAMTGTVIAHDGEPLTITMTFGVAEHQSAHSTDQTVGRADDALYAGKTAGRNRVVLATAD